MRNLHHTDNTWIFRIPWVGFINPSTIMGVSLLVTGLFATLSANLPFAESTRLVLNTVGSVLFAIIVVAFFVTIYLESTGAWARYEFRINLDIGQVIAYDRRANQVLWKSTYQPQQLYISETRVGRYLSRPALVYGDTRQYLVRWDIPTRHKAMLTVASRESLEELMQDLKNASDP